MLHNHLIRRVLTIVIILQLLLSFTMPVIARAEQVVQLEPLVLKPAGNGLAADSAPLADTTLSVNILTSPYATLDSNDPTGANGLVPKTFVVEGQVTNTGSSSATNVIFSLDYNPDPANNWILMPGEEPLRTIETLAPGESFYGYWLAHYSTVIGAVHTYSISAVADNAPLVTTSTNFYGDPLPGSTVRTRGTLSTGNSAVDTAYAIQIGVAFTMTVSYDLGSSPSTSAFSPIGNTDFNAAAYYMSAVSVRFFNDAGTWESTIYDRLAFPTLDPQAQNAEVAYVFTARAPLSTHLCPYNAVRYNTTVKYDQFYCDLTDGTDIPIDGTAKLVMDKQVSSGTIQQGEVLTYTINYSNVGSLPLTYSWIWDDVDTSLASIITSTINPPADPIHSTGSRVAWYLDTIPPGSSGVLTFSVLVDGAGQDIPDGALLENLASFGIDQEGFPTYTAITDTATTLIQAPILSISKTDGFSSAEPGDLLTYTLQVNNLGSIPASGLVITDVLPAYLSLSATPTPPADFIDGQTLVWNSLGPLSPGGGSVTIKIPTTVTMFVPDGTVLTNTMLVKYENPGGHVFEPIEASDTTLVNAPILSISKDDYPDPVLTGNPLTYTLAYTNSGPADATNVIITDVVPLNTTYDSCSGAPCSLSAGVITWNLGTVSANSSASVQFTVIVDHLLPNGTILTNDQYGLLSDQTGFLAGPAVQTTVSVSPASFSGYTFIDANFNGLYDAGDSGLAAVPLTLTQATDPNTQSDANGYYDFAVEIPGPVEVSAALPAGYFRTTPGTVIVESLLGITQTVNFGYAPLGSPFGVIYGTVYQDKNADGTQDPGEYGLPGVTLTSVGGIVSPRTTNEYGQYMFRYNVGGTDSINQTNLPFYVSTTPDLVQADVVLGSSGSSPVDFGDFLGIKITGQVFNDADVDGVKDPGETGVSGALVSAGSQSYSTGTSGSYSLYVAVPTAAPLDVYETDPAGYLSTNALPGAGMVKVDANTLRITSPLSGTVYANGDFGDVLAAEAITITGQVWDDNGAGGGTGGDGLRNGSEAGLPGVLITLSSGLSQLSAADGSFMLYAPPGQTITIAQTNLPGYISTGAVAGTNASVVDSDHITVIGTLSGGQSSLDNLFGDVLIASGLELTKQAEDVNGPPLLVGDTVLYTLETTNTGTLPAYNLTVSDLLPDGVTFVDMLPSLGSVSGPNPVVWSLLELAPSASETLWITVTIDLDQSGATITNTGSLTGSNIIDPPDDPPAVCPDGSQPVNGECPNTPQDQSDIIVVKTASADLVNAGDPLTYTITVTNLGPSIASQTVVTDVLPASLALDTYTASQGTFDSPSGVWMVGSLTPGADATLTLYVTVDPDASGILENTAQASSEDYDPYPGSNRSTVFSSVGALADLTINKSDTPDPVAAGGILTYTLAFANQGPSTAQSLIITDVLPAEVTFLGMVSQPGYLSGPTQNGQTLVWTADTLPAGTVGSIVFTVFVHPQAAGSIQNQAVLSSATAEADPASNQDLESTAIGLSGSSTLFGWVYDDLNGNGVKDTGEAGLPGVLVTLDGTFAALTDADGLYYFQTTLPGLHTLVETDPAGYHSTTPNVVMLDVTLGSSYRIDFGDSLSATSASIYGTVFNDLNVNGLRDPGEPAIPGVLVSLTGGLPATSTTNAWGQYTFLVDAAGTYTISETDNPGWVSTNAVPGSPEVVKLDNHTLRAEVSALGSDLGDNLFADAQQSAVVTISGMVWDDNGAGGGTGGDGLPNGSEPGIPGALVALSSGMSQLTASDGSFILYAPPGQTITIAQTNLPGYISSGAVAGTNAWVVDFDHIAIIDSLGGGQSSLDNLFGDVHIASGLELTKQAEDLNGAPLLVGDTILYTLATTNTGSFPAYNLTVTDLLPEGVTFVDMLPTNGTVSGPNPILWSMPVLEPAASETLWITVTIDLDQSGQTITNTGSLTSSNIVTPPIDPPEVCPDGSLPVNGECPNPPQEQSDLVIDKSASPESVAAGAPLTYTLTVTNLGPSNASQVQVTDLLPGEVTFDSYSASQGSFDHLTGLWEVGSLSAGSSATLDIFVTVNPDASGSLSNSAQASSEDYDPYPESNSDTVLTPVDAFADLTISKSDTPDPVAPGGILTYNLAFANQGPSDAQSLVITDVLPDEVAFLGVVSQPGYLSGPTQNGQTLVWTADALPVGASGSILFTVFVNPQTTGSITNQAMISSLTEDGDPSNNEDSEPTAVGLSGSSTLYGWVYDDLNGNGVKDAGEAGLPDVVVTLDGTSTALTDADGLYFFLTTPPGAHTLVETDPAGYVSTTPNEVHLNVFLGNSYRVDFGDVRDTAGFASIYGTVFEDADGDGSWDANEPGIPGVNVSLDASQITTTDQYGSYSFQVTTPGVHTVVETDPEGYLSTTPNEVHVAVVLGNGYQVDFGDALQSSDFATLYGTVFEDTDMDGVWDTGEIGLAGVSLSLDGDATALTNQYGAYSFAVSDAGTHLVVEIDPDGYVSTTPNEVQVNVFIGDGYQVDFGDVLLCTCDPDAFEDDDTAAGATPIELGPDGRQVRDFCDDSADWLSFTAQAGSVYTLTTSAWGQRADTFLALFDTDGQTLLAANDDYQDHSDYSSQIVWEAPAGGTYFIQVTNRDGLTCCSTDYDIWVEGTYQAFVGQFLPLVVKGYLNILAQPELPALPQPQGVISHMCPDAYEVDDTWELAQPILPDVLQIHSFDSNPALFAADKDVVAFTVYEGDVVTFTVTTLTGTQTLLELFDKYGNALNVTGSTQLVWEVPLTGTYFLSVAPQTQTYGCAYTTGYELLMQLHQPVRTILPLLYK